MAGMTHQFEAGDPPAPVSPSSKAPAGFPAPGGERTAAGAETGGGRGGRGRTRGWWTGRCPRGRQDLLFFGIVAAWLAFDQITKVVVRATLDRGDAWELASFFRFSHVTNTGAAFGLFADKGELLAVSSAVAVVALLVYYFVPTVEHWLMRLGLALILAGAVGNLLDRLYQGHVTDFIDFAHYPAFNVADSGITLGIAALAIYVGILEPRGRTPDRHA